MEILPSILSCSHVPTGNVTSAEMKRLEAEHRAPPCYPVTVFDAIARELHANSN
jgi:hypothetical protein